MEYPTLNLNIYCSGIDEIKINKAYIEENIKSLPFTVNNLLDGENYNFKVWIVNTDSKSKLKNSVLCYARHLRADLVNGKLEYDIDLPSEYYWILTSDFFDSFVDPKGDKIEVAIEDIGRIQFNLDLTLNQHYHTQIESNKKETKTNILKATEKYPSLKDFVVHDNIDQTRKILKEHEIVNNAIENKGRIEKTYWNNKDVENEEIDKLINSSLHIYVAHRSRVLDKFHDMILRFDRDGEKKSEPEDDIHDLFLRRGEKLSTSENINHLHNLWILDDKFTVFSETTKGLSSRKGQELSDIYLWIDDPEKINELLILELKSTTNAHNAGDRYESMVAQVKRYAAQFYKEPNKILAWDIDPKRILFSGIILARKSDINKELNSNNTSGIAHKIPYLSSSYFYNERFSIAPSDSSVPVYNEIRIELLAFEDVYELAKNRNKVFFKLLNGEYRISET
jgi:beta-lactamase class D